MNVANPLNIEQALTFIDPHDRETWIKCGMAIKSELGDTGFDIWDQWSANADNYDLRSAIASWRSFTLGGGITIGTLFKLAKDNGYTFDINNKPIPLTCEQITERERKCQLAEKEQAKRRADAAARASIIWDDESSQSEGVATDVSEHPYLIKKGIKSHGAKIYRGNLTIGEMDCNGALMIPMKSLGKITSLQFINSNGEKRFLPTGEKGGYLIGKVDDNNPICVAEGFATGATIHEATSYPVVVCFDAGNMCKVAEALRIKFTKQIIVLCADDDSKNGDTGLKVANKSALAVDGLVAVTSFGADRPDSANDFNDMAKLYGNDAVKQAIDAAKPPVSLADTRERDLENNWVNTLEPEPLRAILLPAEAYPVEALGEILGNAAKAIHESVKAPLALCCQSVLAAASLAVQAHFDIKLPWGERKPLSLFLLTVGESGERKSGVDDLVLGAAKTQERKDMEFYSEDLKQYQSEVASWTQATEAARKSVTRGKKITMATARDVQLAVDDCGEKPEAPIVPLRFMTDPTVEGMYKQLMIGQPSVALFSDEGGLLIGGHALNSDNALKTMARWCKLWDGSPFDRVRAGDGAGILYGRRMAFHQLAQPDVMATLLSNRMANGQGLLARCLVAWPDSTIGTRHINSYQWAGDRNEIKRLFAELKGLMEAEPRTAKSPQELDPMELPLSDDAKDLAIAANNQFESLMAKGADLAELRDRASKAVENACRIAGVLAVIEGGLSVRLIEKIQLERALVLVQWYLSEALRIRGATSIPQSVLDAEQLSAWLYTRSLKQFRSKQILKSGPNQLRNKTRLMAAIYELVSNGYLVENEKGTVVDGVAATKSWRVIHVV